ncbi:MAG TPA: hypothetical protein VEG61_06690 [Candidatus Dormibacteraeota bacterium]|nr:hypothetical protein [Candidatus Dormibacteraeota bacterium]
MKRFRVVIPCFLAFIYVLLLASSNSVQAVSVMISTDQPIYPLWGIGGTVRIGAQNLTSGVSYYLWLQKPKQFTSSFTRLSLTSTNGTTTSNLLPISPDDPPGTYLLSLSRSETSDTHEAMAHFGVVGTNSRIYERIETVTIAGGGFVPNSTIALAINSANGTFPGFPVNVTAQGTGGFSYDFKLLPSAETGNLTATISGLTYDKHQLNAANYTFVVNPSTISVRTLQNPAAQVERTLQVNTTYQISYADGSPVTAAVNATADVILAGQRLLTVPLVIVNSTSGEWRATWIPSPSANKATYHFQFNQTNFTDSYGNKGKGPPVISSDFKVIPASLTFYPQVPITTERTTALNLTNTVYYPDGTTLNSTVTLEISAGNQTWTPNLSFDSANGMWSGSLYLVQNATLGRYNVTWTAHDPYGNSNNSTYTTLVVPARFSFVVEANSSTVYALSNLDLPVLVSYPNGSSLTNSFGNVTGSYENSTRYVFTLPLAYNSTNGTWHMIFFVPQQANATLSFNATDRFGNSAIATDAYNLKIVSIPIRIQNLIIAAVIGALIPIGLLIWAIATISTRKRKHRP